MRWSILPLGFVELNIDESSLGNPSECGCERIVRDSRKDLLSGFMAYYRSNTMAETKALLDGLRICTLLQQENIVVEIDSQLLANWWNRKGDVHRSLREVWKRIDYSAKDLNLVVRHAYREINQVDEFSC
ncbi:uncharacterized protein LOC122310389 [Carya illinoinensis]|uniref:uncharacterized protein LOC122310389 n=1 Tax=Carya illinoinensis TaxID=32201 RepID=UPI001C71A166|nr:uncharacterized protein LOC122310389 [Carya illinoinensis]